MSFHIPPKHLRKEIKRLEKERNSEIKQSEKAQKKGDLRTAIVHKDRAVEAQLEANRLRKIQQQQFVPITQVRSNF